MWPGLCESLEVGDYPVCCIEDNRRLCATPHAVDCISLPHECSMLPKSDNHYKSFPEYDWLNDLLHSGKSGTMFLSRAKESAGQFRNEGSLTFTR